MNSWYSNIFLKTIDENQNSYLNEIVLSFDQDGEVRHSTTSYYVYDEYDSYELNNIQYGETYHIKSNVRNIFRVSEDPETMNNEYWITKSHWIVKKIIKTKYGTEYWSLVRCNIKN